MVIGVAKKILKVVGIIALVSTVAIIGVGLAAGLSLSTLTGLTVSVAGVSLGISVGTLGVLGLAAYSLGNKPKIDLSSAAINDFSRGLSITSSATNIRAVHYGTVASAGQLAFQEYSGDEGQIMRVVLILSGTEVDSLVSMELNDQAITLPTISLPGTPGGAVTSGNFADKLKVYWHDGRDTVDPFTALTSDSAAWAGETRNLRGLPAVYVEATLDEDFEGRFEPVFVFKGRKIYDPRLDSTVVGGSGTHRIDDDTTWEWSDNGVLPLVDYLIGINVNNVRVAGMAKPPEKIDMESLITAANICDESVALLGGGSEKRYTLNGLINPSNRHGDNIALMVDAIGGWYSWANRRFTVYAGAYIAPTETISEEDMLGIPISYKRYPALNERVNTVSGFFIDASNGYVANEYPSATDSSLVVDHGQELIERADFPFTTSGTMAQRLATIRLRRAQLFKKFNAIYNRKNITALPGTNATLTYEPLGLSSEIMLIDGWELSFPRDSQQNPALAVALTLREENPSVYDWSTADEQTVSVPATIVPRTNGLLAGRTRYLGGDGRANNDIILPNTSNGGGEFTESGTSLSSFDAGADATISVGAFSRDFSGATTVSYNSGSVTGLSFATQYYVYARDPSRTGGAVTYQASTNLTDVVNDVDNIYMGKVTTVVDGATGGTGGTEDPWCVSVDQYLIEGLKAGDAKAGDLIDVLRFGGFESEAIHSVDFVETECVEITSDCGAILICSALTPITQPDGSCIYARFSLGKQAACDDARLFGWQKIIKVQEVGWRQVARIHIGGQTYAAGSSSQRRIFTHNPLKL